MKSVLMSIHPKWCELIASGKKTVEVRKTKPKIETPFKVYIYETKALYKPNGCRHLYEGKGKVIGEFVCETIFDLNEEALFAGMDEINNSVVEEYSCVDIDELLRYKGDKKEIYGWTISDLIIYDKPKELREFKPYNRKEEDCLFSHLGLAAPKCEDCKECYVKRVPQSWCYIEGVVSNAK